MTVRYANEGDFELLCSNDRHIRADELRSSIEAKRVLVILDGGRTAGWLRYNLFWDHTPFINLLFLLEGWRGRGLGGQLVSFWEEEMKTLGYQQVMTSSLANERAQFFYRRHGYVDCGSLLLPGEALEIIFRKEL